MRQPKTQTLGPRKPGHKNRPHCPHCGIGFSLFQVLTAWNPWKYRCPHCATLLETTQPYKQATIAAMVLGLVIAAVAVIMEKSGRWQTVDSMVYFMVVFIVLAAIWALVWRRTRFIIRDRGDGRRRPPAS